MHGRCRPPCKRMLCIFFLLLLLLLLLLLHLHFRSSLFNYSFFLRKAQQRGEKGAEDQMQNQNQNQKRWSYRLRRWLTDAEAKREERERQEKPKGKTGTGVKASGKRQRCGIEDCPAFASPSGSGFCSHHEQQMTPVGEKVADAKKFKCRTFGCTNPQMRDVEFCRDCTRRRYEAAVSGDDDLDTLDSGLGNVDEL
jgi:hypothetical protein